MNCLDNTTRAKVISCLIEGCSIRATVRMTGASKPTVVKLLAEIGGACAAYHNRSVRHLKSVVYSAMRFGRSLEPRRRMSAPKRSKRVGAMFGRGSESTRIRSWWFRT